MQLPEPRELLTRLYKAAVLAANPRQATRQAVKALEELTPSVWIFAVGKGSHAMATGAVEALKARNIRVEGGLVVAHEPDPDATHGLDSVEGDHPVPDVRSFEAADRLANSLAKAGTDADAIVLVSGGATSLIAAPIEGISHRDLQDTFDALLASGVDIGLMNAVRKRLLRFGAGRLALALASKRVLCRIASDVVGNDTSSIASGPCVADSSTATETRDRALAANAWHTLPMNVRNHIDAIAGGRLPDVPPPDHPRFASTVVRVILDRSDAERGAAAAAKAMGITVEIRPEPLSGDAATMGARFAKQLMSPSRSRPGVECVIRSGETTVSLGASSGKGGRCQELALACAGELHSAGDKARGITVLAAGTDGRDGPTDAAGAIIDATTWSTVQRKGVDPAAALRDHAAYGALESADALLRTGSTGTNVNDVVIALLAQAPVS